MTFRMTILVLLTCALSPAWAQNDDARMLQAIEPLMKKCPIAAKMVKRWKADRPGPLAALVRSWQAAPIIEKRYFGGRSTESDWGDWEIRNGGALSAPVAGGRMLVEMFQVPGSTNPGELLGVTGEQRDGYVSVLAYVDAPDCFVLTGKQVGDELHFAGRRAEHRLGLRTNSLKLPAVRGHEAVQIDYDRRISRLAFSINQQAGCLAAGATDCTGNDNCCGSDARCVEEKSEQSSASGATKIVYQNVCR